MSDEDSLCSGCGKIICEECVEDFDHLWWGSEHETSVLKFRGDKPNVQYKRSTS